MKKIVAFLLAVALLLTSFSYEPFINRAAAASETVVEAEDGRIYFGKLMSDETASGKLSVKLGENRPASASYTGVYWYVNAAQACTTTVTLSYSSGASAVAYFYCNNVALPNNNSPEALKASANQEKLTKTYDLTLNAGVNELVLLCFNDTVTIDKLTLNTDGVTLVKESPNVIDAANDITFYYSKDARVHMGQIAPNEYAVSKSCVIFLKDNNGYVDFSNVYSASGGYYQLILFCAANAGSNVKISVNRQDYTVPVYQPMGWGAFTDGTNRTHAVVNCNLKPGNNQVIVSCVDNDVCIDMIQVARQDTYARYEAEYAAFESPAWKVDDATVSGTGFVAGINDVNSEVRFKVNVTEDGEYTMCTRYYASTDMNGATDGEPTYRVYTDKGYYGEISLKNDAATWQTAIMNISLKAGENEIIFKNGNGNAYLDYIGISAKTGSYQNPTDQRSGTAFEAEDTQILFGKLMQEESASGGVAVKLGEDLPAGRTSGVIEKVSAEKAQTVPVTIWYSSEQDAVLNIVTIDQAGTVLVQPIKLSASGTKEHFDITLSEGENTIQLLYASGGAVTVDKFVMHAEGIAAVTEKPLQATEKDTIYYSCNARVYMGNIGAAENSVSGSCVFELVHSSGNGYVEFDNVYSEEGGNYQLIVFCAGEEGNEVKVSVNGQEYIANLNLPMGKNIFANAKDERSHAVVRCKLLPGNNRIVVQGVNNADIQVDALMVSYQSASVQNFFDTKNGTGFEAEDGQIVFGKIGSDKSASGGMTVKLGEDRPVDRNSGIFWKANAEAAGETSVIIEYSAKEDAQVLFFNNDILQATVDLAAGETKAVFPVSLSKGDNNLAVLYASGGAVTVDRIVLDTKKISMVKEEPLIPAENALLYFARNARVHMGNIVASETSISASSVSELIHGSGNGYVEFDDIYSETGGYYQLIAFCAGEEGNEVKVSVNGQEYTASLNLPMGRNIFANASDARSHVVIVCKLNPGNNQIRVQSAGNADMQVDALMVTFLSNNTRYEAEDGEVTNAVIKGKGQEYDYGTYSGSGFVGNIDVDSSEVRFKVTVEEDGEYEIGICYATGTTEVDARPTFRVYTQNGYYDEVILPNVTGWGNFSLDTVAKTKVSLKAGENEIIIKKGMDNAELDYIEIGERVGDYKDPIEEPDYSGIRYDFEDKFAKLSLESEKEKNYVLPVLIGSIAVVAALVIVSIIILKKRKKGETDEK